MDETDERKVAKGFLWTSVEQFGSKTISTVLSIILARLLSPDHFGVIAICTVFFLILSAFIEGGFSDALIQKRNSTDDDYATVFWFNLGTALLLYLLLFVCAPFIAEFFEESSITSVLRVFGLSLIISAFSIVQRVTLLKNLDFRKIAQVKIPSLLGSSIVGIALAFYGFGVWALVVQQLSLYLIETMLLWMNGSWRLVFKFSRHSFNNLFYFGSKLLFSNLLSRIYANSYRFFIGKFYSPATLGLYSKSVNLQQLPSSTIVSIFTKVAYPYLVRYQDDNTKLKFYYGKLLGLSTFLLFPIIAWMTVFAEDIVLFLLGPKWEEAGKYLQIVSLAGFFYPFNLFSIELFKVKRRGGLFLKLELMKKTMFIATILVLVSRGIEVILIGEVVITGLCTMIYVYFSGREINSTIYSQVSSTSFVLLWSVASAIVIYLLTAFVDESIPLRVLSSSVGVAALYLGGVYIFKKSLINDIVDYTQLWSKKR